MWEGNRGGESVTLCGDQFIWEGSRGDDCHIVRGPVYVGGKQER
jgi:hypothetical protein